MTTQVFSEYLQLNSTLYLQLKVLPNIEVLLHICIKSLSEKILILYPVLDNTHPLAQSLLEFCIFIVYFVFVYLLTFLYE